MRQIEGNPQPIEYWDYEEVMINLNYTEMKAKALLEEIHRQLNDHRYGPLDKEIILSYIAQKERNEREREARHQSDLANVESVTILKEQVKTLREQVQVLNQQAAISKATELELHEQVDIIRAMAEASSKDAVKNRFIAMLGLALSAVSIAFAFWSFCVSNHIGQ